MCWPVELWWNIVILQVHQFYSCDISQTTCQSLFHLLSPSIIGCGPADADHWQVYSWGSMFLLAGNGVKGWDRKLGLEELLYSRAKFGFPLMFAPCPSPTGNCVCNAGRDHRAGHGTLWLPGGPRRGRCGVYVSLDCAPLSCSWACTSSSWQFNSPRVWGDY